MSSFENGSGSESPARSTMTLVFDGVDGVVISPVPRGGNILELGGVDLSKSLRSPLARLVTKHTSVLTLGVV